MGESEITACGELFGMSSKVIEGAMEERKYGKLEFVKQLQHV